MPYSSGTFSRVHDFTDDRDNGIRIQASRMDAEMDGIATGLSTALLKDGTQTATAKIPFAVGLSVIDNQTILLGTNSDIAIQYDETTNDSLEISANVEGAALGIVLKSDQGDDNADQHKLSIADGGTLTLGSKISGSFVSYLTHTPNATVASSTLAVAGNLTVGGNLTLGSGAELSEAELEMLDGITAGTVAASKAVVVDANKDIASFRNVTLTGELDAATGDFSGDVDVDGTLEADAITVNGTALATVIAGTTVTTATNANHVSVADNESTNEENLIPFIEDASATGNVGLESDGDFAYNPSTGTVSATVFKGNIDAVDGDFDGTLEADAMTLNGTSITTVATLSTGISNGNLPVFTSGVADDDFLRVNGTSIEGRSASEVLSDIGASAVAGSSSIVTTGALNAGSITSGFGTIDTGSSTITTTGVGTFGSLDISGDIDVDGTTNLDVVDIDGAVDMASTLQVDGAITSSAGMTITTADNTDTLTLKSTDADANTGPTLFMQRDSASPADGDSIGKISFVGDNDAGETTRFARIDNQIADASNGTEDALMFITTMIGGTELSRMTLQPTEAVFNEESADIDFRVESNGNANMLFVDGGNDRVGIGTSSPNAKLTSATTDGGSAFSIHRDFSGDVGASETGTGSFNFTLTDTATTDQIVSRINSVGVAGTGDAFAGSMRFYTAGNDGNIAERMRITSAGKVGIGETAPLGILHIKEGDSGVTSVSTDADQLVIENNAEAGISILAPTNSASRIAFGDSDNNKIGMIYYNHTSNYMQFTTNNVERMRIDSSGNVLINTSSATGHKMTVTSAAGAGAADFVGGSTNGYYAVRVDMPSTNTYGVLFRSNETNVGDIRINSSSTAYNTSSDHRLKENVDYTFDATTRLKQLKPARFNFIADADTTVDGFLAHEVQSVVPEAITGTHNEVDDDGNPVYQGIDQSKLVPLLVKTIQELEARIVALETA